ncbi:hypothetical protein HYX06_06105 [Candidatus Woesearchaeota archaeon]|nr:hypothetical protein [Candidatus Woesearchaeota archaeon]
MKIIPRKIIQRDVNKSLLVLNMFFLLLFLAFTVYYQIALKNTLKEKDGYSEKIGDITAQAVMQKMNKSDTAKELALIDKVVLENKYSELLAQKEKLEEDKEALKGEITILNSQIEYHQARLEGPVAQFRLIQEKNAEIQKLNEKIGLLCLKIGSYNITAKEC